MYICKMKVKLLKKLRYKGGQMITIHSTTKTNGTMTGMSYGYDSDDYKGLFSYGDSELDVKYKAFYVYMENNIGKIREKYKKYSRKTNY